ncbi:Uncharacterised protein [Citrobacter koseri]|nr:Uncharacterised protein [Citrobacter koseri]STT21659.1 Uncharacterised protein [Citrobacter koseri]
MNTRWQRAGQKVKPGFKAGSPDRVTLRSRRRSGVGGEIRGPASAEDVAGVGA